MTSAIEIYWATQLECCRRCRFPIFSFNSNWSRSNLILHMLLLQPHWTIYHRRTEFKFEFISVKSIRTLRIRISLFSPNSICVFFSSFSLSFHSLLVLVGVYVSELFVSVYRGAHRERKRERRKKKNRYPKQTFECTPMNENRRH